MVNFSLYESDDKKLAVLMSPNSKSIKKSKANNTQIKISKSSGSLSIPPSNIQKAKECSFELNKNSYTNASEQTSFTTENFLTFSNFPLYPSNIQILFQSYPNFSTNELKRAVYGLKVPNNFLSFKKKLEKFKLLSLSQETFVQNYLKDKYQSSLNPMLLKEYYGYLKCKIQVNNQIQEFLGKRFGNEDSQHIFPWQNNGNKEAFNKSHLCTPTTTFNNESFLPEDVLDLGPKEFQVKYEESADLKQSVKNPFCNDDEERFKGDFETKAMENMGRCKDFEYFLLKQEEHLENGGQMNFRFNVWQD